LLIIPYAARNPGAPLAELAGIVSMTAEELAEELDFLMLVGQPPFAPDDCVDIRVEDGRVYVELDQALGKPPRLTPLEGLALAAAARGMAGADEGTIARAMAKIEAALPGSLLPLYRELLQRFEVARLPGEADMAALLRRAIHSHREVELDYFSESRGESTHRPVHPRALRYAQGHWYLSAYCLTRKGDRLFRVDRIREAKLTDRSFDRLPPEERPPAEPGEPPAPPVPPESERPRLRLTGGAAIRYAEERFGAQALEMLGAEPPQAILSLSGPADAWTVSFALSFGGAAEVLEPEGLRAAVRDRIASTLEAYR
jgi:proteasome accessory factor C